MNELIKPDDFTEIHKALKDARMVLVQTQFGTAVKVSKAETRRWLEKLERRRVTPPTYETSQITPGKTGNILVFRS